MKPTALIAAAAIAVAALTLPSVGNAVTWSYEYQRPPKPANDNDEYNGGYTAGLYYCYRSYETEWRNGRWTVVRYIRCEKEDLYG